MAVVLDALAVLMFHYASTAETVNFAVGIATIAETRRQYSQRFSLQSHLDVWHSICLRNSVLVEFLFREEK
jgi:hypothetical protein